MKINKDITDAFSEPIEGNCTSNSTGSYGMILDNFRFDNKHVIKK